ncbi:MAG: hypothetical protein ACXVP2_13710, partial [Tumebacillaceae bacterium]
MPGSLPITRNDPKSGLITPFNKRISDWGFRAAEPDGPFGGGVARWYYWWNDACQDEFDRLWADDADL